MNNLNGFIFPDTLNRPILPIEKSIFTDFNQPVSSHYDNKVKVYEWLVSKKWYNGLVWGTSPMDYTEFARLSLPDDNKSTIDIGCGGLALTSRVYGSVSTPLLLVDNSLPMLKSGYHRIKTYSNREDNTNFLQADAFHLPLKDQSFQRVLSFGMLHMFDHKDDFIKEMMRILTPDGEFYFSVLTTDRRLGGRYLKFLHKKKEIGIPVNSSQVLEMLKPFQVSLTYHQTGNMLFISGKKQG